MRERWRAAGMAGLALTAGIAATGAHAAEWAVTPHLSLATELDDNGALRHDDPQTVAGVTMDVGAALSVRGERSSLTVTPRLSLARFDDDPDTGLDRNDWRVVLRSYRNAERDRFAVSGKLVRDSTRTSELVDTGLVESDARRTLVTATPTWRHAFSERWTTDVSTSIADVAYAGAAGTGLLDYRYYVGALTVTYRSSTRTAVQATAQASRYHADDVGARSDSAGLRVGLRLALTETLSSHASLGARAARARTGIGPGPRSATSSGLLFDAGLEKRYERARIAGQLSRQLAPSSSGGLRERDELHVAAAHGLTPRLEARTALLVSESRDVDEPAAPSRYQRLTVGLWWRVSPYWLLSGEYRHSRLDAAGAAPPADSNALLLTLHYDGDKRAISR